MRVFLDLWWYFKREKTSYIIGIIMLMIVSILSLLPPYIVGVVVDLMVENNLTVEGLTFWLIILFFVGLAAYIFRYLWRIMIFGASIRLARLLRNQLYEHFTNMSAKFYQRRKTGDLMAHATNDIRAVEQTAGAGVLTLVDSLTLGGFVIITMAVTISWELTLLSLLPLPLLAFLTNFYGSMLHKRFRVAQAAFSSLNDRVQESIAGIRVTKTFGQEKADIAAFQAESDDVVKKNLRVSRIDALFDPTITFIIGVSYFLAVYFGAGFVINEDITIGQLTSFTIYLGLLVWPMLAFGWLFNIVERGRASYGRISELLAEQAEITDEHADTTKPPSGRFDVEIHSFRYKSEDDPVLNDVRFQLKEGETLGVIGRTGSGKTTLMKLLMREEQGVNGKISLDYRSIERYTLDALRTSFGYVPQDQFLFSATIADNIAFAKPNATMQEVIDAAKLACVHEDIVQFQNGYETFVGERGVTLSGGQKQRIAIARALLVEPEILMFDDSLSAVDAKTEESILEALRMKRSERTTIISAHRLSAVKHADVILVLDQGKVVEQGTHESLMKKDGWYREVYNQQQLESIVAEGGDTGGTYG
ncbi:ATP-binding cassette subfamily B protein [Salsuginibacillus halophilus]|uniref:ATP-binding cassette subfamily B protein n=1 Tax=Salsuginibacillus halophilus TaxID=517424 RepID=A0A2P8HYJ3_9BACI|nr:ABC transporter transmembrane domain-containing protein [Salsuginibacillus halophilus]PSL51308.1 ATP-binding cassette subfamily B protein [Salsuginibacillus halophilus]